MISHRTGRLGCRSSEILAGHGIAGNAWLLGIFSKTFLARVWWGMSREGSVVVYILKNAEFAVRCPETLAVIRGYNFFLIFCWWHLGRALIQDESQVHPDHLVPGDSLEPFST
jgi:hypothetical protein